VLWIVEIGHTGVSLAYWPLKSRRAAVTGITTTLALELDWQPWHRAVGTGDTAIDQLRTQRGVKTFALERVAAVDWRLFDLVVFRARADNLSAKFGLLGHGDIVWSLGGSAKLWTAAPNVKGQSTLCSPLNDIPNWPPGAVRPWGPTGRQPRFDRETRLAGNGDL